MAIKGIFFHFSDPIFPTSIMPIIEVKKSQKNGVKKIKPNQSESNQKGTPLDRLGHLRGDGACAQAMKFGAAGASQ
jgi:hypothetical protein